MNSEQVFTSSFLFFIPILIPLVFQRRRRQMDDNNNSTSSTEDQQYLRRAHQLRRALEPPRLSQFRVVALFALDNGKFILGTNDEPSPTISGALCAERCALLHYRMQYYNHSQQQRPKVTTVYIVTDAPQPVPPGTLCREYMYGHDAILGNAGGDATNNSTRFVLQSADPASEPLITTLDELYPYPSLYNRLTAAQQVAKATALQTQMKTSPRRRLLSQPPRGFSQPHDIITRLVQAAVQATARDDRNDVFCMRYAAAALLTDDKIVTAPQVKTLEYGASQDALCQLFARINNMAADNDIDNNDDDVRLLVFCDSMGIVHSPFAVARSVWTENGKGHVPVLIRDDLYENNNTSSGNKHSEEGGCWKAVPMRDLTPMAPEFR